MLGPTAPISLTVPLTLNFLPNVTTFVDKAVQALGLSRKEADKLTLASEELFVAFSRANRKSDRIVIEAVGRGYEAEIRFLFDRIEMNEVNLAKFNLTAKLHLDSETELDQLGLLIASRMVDRFSFFNDPMKGLGIILIKEKTYPAIDIRPQPGRPVEEYTIAPARDGEANLTATLLGRDYPKTDLPHGFSQPGRLTDMITEGGYQLALAQDRTGWTGGCIIWRILNRNLIECFGPYLFGQPTESKMSRDLVDFCLESAAKTEALILVRRHPNHPPPRGAFEELGRIYNKNGDSRRWFRMMSEDPGCRVWAHPRLQNFLKDNYQRLHLPRQLAPVGDFGHNRPLHSVLAAELDNSLGQALLQPTWDGLDFKQNLETHLRVLADEGFEDIILSLDLGSAWQAALAGEAIEAGMTPRYVLPYGGSADTVFFEGTIS